MSDYIRNVGYVCNNDAHKPLGICYNHFSQEGADQEGNTPRRHNIHVCRNIVGPGAKNLLYTGGIEKSLPNHIDIVNAVIPDSVTAQKDKTIKADKVLQLSKEDKAYKLEVDNREKQSKTRKELHNKVEKKRMSFINEKIKELGDLLPENAKRRSCQTKGLILKESVEYLKILQKDKDIIQPLLLKIQKLDAVMVTLSEKIQQLDNQMQIQETGFLDYAKVSHAASPYHLYDQP